MRVSGRWTERRAGGRSEIPDRGEDLQHVGRVDLGDRSGADAREGVPFEAPPPVLRVPPASPAAALLFEHAPGGIGEGGNALDAALVGQRLIGRNQFINNNL